MAKHRVDEVKVCDACKTLNLVSLSKCHVCKNDTFTPLRTHSQISVLSEDVAQSSLTTEKLSTDSESKFYEQLDDSDLNIKFLAQLVRAQVRTNEKLDELISEQQKTRFYVRWGFGVIGLTLLVAFYGIGVKVNLSPTTITPYP
jgi:hypothetical protein